MIYPETFEQKVGFANIRQSVSEKCVSELGSTHCVSMAFSTDINQVKLHLQQTAEMLSIITGDNSFPITGLIDVTPQLQSIKIDGTYIQAIELGRLRRDLELIDGIWDFFGLPHRDGQEVTLYPALCSLAADMERFPNISRCIERIIDIHTNTVKDTASPQLAEIRRNLTLASGSINRAMRRVMAQAMAAGYIDTDTTPAVRDGRLVIPVAPMHKRRIQGIVHDESATGKTLYIEPAEVVEANNRLRELQAEERQEIIRILKSIAADIRPSIPGILASFHILGLLDFIHAKAHFAHDINATLPTITDSQEMEWWHACHPVLLLNLQSQGKQIVPLDITLTAENRILVISGPNAGGKSVTLKTVGIIQYMIQCGLLPPVAENSHIGVFNDILLDIGDDQSIENDLSTYSSHLRNMKLMLSRGNNKSLVLIDEFGGGTEPQIGGALAQSILKQFNENGMWGIITTHYQNLKQYAEETPGLINGSMLYDRQLMQPMFKLSIGNAGSSFAIEIARKTGLPENIIKYAEDIVGSDYINMDRYLLDIARDRRYWENKRMAIRQKEKKLEELTSRYESDAETLRLKRREILEQAKEEAIKIVENSNAVVERTIHDIRKAQADKAKTLEARRKLQEESHKLTSRQSVGAEPELLKKAPKPKRVKQETKPIHERPISVGDNVKLDGQGTVGRVMSTDGKTAIVSFGMLKTTVNVNRLKHTLAKADTGASRSASFISSSTTDSARERQLHFRQEIDVRGMRVDEAVQAVTYFIDDAIQFNAQKVRILHGTGTGALRQYIRNYLATVPSVALYHDEDVRFGGAGITVVELS